MKWKMFCGAVAAMGFSIANVSKAQGCNMLVLAPVTDDLGNHWAAGKTLPADIERRNGRGDAFCATGGGCILRMVNGTPALRLLNCKGGPSLGGGDFRLVPDPRLAGASAAVRLQARQNAEGKLVDLGFSMTAAGSFAQDYADHPQSHNGRLVARALAGSPSAVAAMKRIMP